MDFEEKLYQARLAGSLGDFESSRTILKEMLDEDAGNADAWLLLADVVEKPEFSLKCLQRVLKIEPENKIASAKLTEWQAVQDVTLESEQWHLHAFEQSTETNQDFDFAPSTPPSREKTMPALRKHWEVILIGVLAVCAAILLGVLFLPPGAGLPQNTANAAASQPLQEVTAVIFENIRASNAEDPDLYMSTIHPKSPGYQQTLEMLAPLFDTYDLSYQISDLSITSQNEKEAVVAFVLTTRKIRGPEFRDNRVSGEMILRPDEGSWKIYNQTVDQVEYLE